MLSYDVRRGLAQVVAVREVSERQPRGSGCEGLPMVGWTASRRTGETSPSVQKK